MMPNHRHRRAIAPATHVREILFWALVAALTLVAFAILSAPVASAQTADAIARPTESLLNSPAVGILLQLAIVVFGPIAAGFGTLLLARLYTLAGLKQTEANRATIEQVLARAVQYAQWRYPGVTSPGTPVSPIHVAAAASYALEAGPKALAREGIRDSGSARLQQMIETRLAAPPPALLVTPASGVAP